MHLAGEKPALLVLLGVRRRRDWQPEWTEK
jgi:hypothetical protein